MSDIFISYANEDRERIRPLVLELMKTGWSVFWDRSIPTGQTWQKVIGHEIETCRTMIVIWSRHSVESDWVLDEADEGKRRQVLFPLRIDDVPLPYGFRRIQVTDLLRDDAVQWSRGMRRLIGDLAATLGTPPSEIVEDIEDVSQHGPEDPILPEVSGDESGIVTAAEPQEPPDPSPPQMVHHQDTPSPKGFVPARTVDI